MKQLNCTKSGPGRRPPNRTSPPGTKIARRLSKGGEFPLTNEEEPREIKSVYWTGAVKNIRRSLRRPA